MEIFEAAVEGTSVLYVSGRVNSATSAELARRLLAAVDSGAASVVVDLSRLVHITSAGFRALLQGDRHADQTGTRIVLCGLDGLVHELFEIGGFLEMFTIARSREEALHLVTTR
jgi:anti-anti-sigma factor